MDKQEMDGSPPAAAARSVLSPPSLSFFAQLMPDNLRHPCRRRRVAAALGADDAVDDGHADASVHHHEDAISGTILELSILTRSGHLAAGPADGCCPAA